MSTPTAVLTEMLESVAPVRGVSIGKIEDKSTWLIHYDGTENAEQIAAALFIVERFDYNKEQAQLKDRSERRNKAYEKMLKHFEGKL